MTTKCEKPSGRAEPFFYSHTFSMHGTCLASLMLSSTSTRGINQTGRTGHWCAGLYAQCNIVFAMDGFVARVCVFFRISIKSSLVRFVLLRSRTN